MFSLPGFLFCLFYCFRMIGLCYELINFTNFLSFCGLALSFLYRDREHGAIKQSNVYFLDSLDQIMLLG